MTPDRSSLALDALLDAARLVAARIPGADSLGTRPLGVAERAGLAPGEDLVALAVRVTGTLQAEVALFVAGSATLALGGTNAAGGIAQVWTPALAEVVAALEGRLRGLHPEAVREVDATTGFRPQPDSLQQAVGLYDGERLAALLLLTEDSSESAPRMSAPAFQPLAAAVPVASPTFDPRHLRLLRDVQMEVSVELGRTRMPVRDLLSLAPGAIVELDRAAGSPVDILVNGTLIARGEVVVIDEEFAVRVSEIVSPELDGRLGA